MCVLVTMSMAVAVSVVMIVAVTMPMAVVMSTLMFMPVSGSVMLFIRRSQPNVLVPCEIDVVDRAVCSRRDHEDRVDLHQRLAGGDQGLAVGLIPGRMLETDDVDRWRAQLDGQNLAFQRYVERTRSMYMCVVLPMAGFSCVKASNHR